MELRKVHVRNFRSVEDSGQFEIDQLTCLVGKNEAGKTAILQALAGLNPHEATPIVYDKERDYPRRHLTDYDADHSDEDAVVVETVWLLDDDEIEKIAAEFGPACLTGHEVTVLRRYNSDAPEWRLPVDWEAAVNYLISQANFSAPERSQIKSPTNTQTLREAIKSIDSPTPKHQRLLERLDSYPGKSIIGHITSMLTAALPRFMYFSNYDRMSGQVRLENLRASRDDQSLFKDDGLRGERLFYEFLEYAGAPLDDILSATTYESFSARLQGASNNITDQILDYWSQNQFISVDVRVNQALPDDPPPFNKGVIGRARIYNSLHRVDVPFSERSAGFIWFFSFLVKFARVRDDKGPIILLLDEPGLTLHGKAQSDLLRYFEERLVPHHQVIYSTHSPFMVPADRLTSARIVEDIVDTRTARPKPIGTKVRDDVLQTDPDTIFPLQGALGYEITQTLFVGKHTLLVEGPSDILYLKALSSALVRRNRHGLDGRWVLCPSGGIGNIRPFVSLFKGNDLNIAVLTDFARGDKNRIESLRASQILRTGAVLTVDQFTDKSEADTEDIFEPEVFVELLNQSYSLTGEHLLTIEKLMAADEHTSRLVKKAEAYFRLLPESIPVFDHYRPAEWLIEHPDFLDGEGRAQTVTLDRAERLFEAINGLVVEQMVL